MSPAPPSPSGEQIEIAHGGQRAVITEVGATLRLYEAGGRAVLDGFAADEIDPACHGNVLAPWPNRVSDGRYVAPDGTEQQLDLTEPKRGHALHGLVHWAPWQVAERRAGAVRMECELRPLPGYPFQLHMAAEYSLDDEGLRCTITATNRGAATAPYGAGHHPYFACPGGRVDNARLRLPAAAILEADQRLIPTGRVLDVEGTPFDFREERAVGATELDHCFARLQPDADGVCRASLSDGATWRTTLWMQPPFRWLMVFSSDPLTGPRHRRALAMEPMTCPPNAFRTGEDVVLLQPGESCAASFGITPERL